MNTKKRTRRESDCDSLFYWAWDNEITTSGIPVGDADVVYNKNGVYSITGSSRFCDNTRIIDNDNMKKNKIFIKL